MNRASDKYQAFRDDLKHYQQQGVSLYLDDQKASPDKIINACCVHEQGSYMGDYIMNEDGKLVMLRFDKIAKDKIKE